MQGEKTCAGTIEGMIELPEGAHKEPELCLSLFISSDSLNSSQTSTFLHRTCDSSSSWHWLYPPSDRVSPVNALQYSITMEMVKKIYGFLFPPLF